MSFILISINRFLFSYLDGVLTDFFLYFTFFFLYSIEYRVEIGDMLSHMIYHKNDELSMKHNCAQHTRSQTRMYNKQTWWKVEQIYTGGVHSQKRKRFVLIHAVTIQVYLKLTDVAVLMMPLALF